MNKKKLHKIRANAGSLGGTVKTKKKIRASKRNGKKGGRPRKGESRADYMRRKFGVEIQ